MGNSQGHSSEVEAVKETPSCCELKRRKSKSKGTSPDEQDEQETKEELFLGNEMKHSLDTMLVNTDGNHSLSKRITEVTVVSDVPSDDKTDNSLAQQDITKLKLDSDVSDSQERLYECGEHQANHANDATYEKEGTVANNVNIVSALPEKNVKQAESGGPVQSVLPLKENTGNLENESRTLSYTYENICHADVIIPETNNTSTPMLINTHHKTFHTISPVTPDSPLPFKSAMQSIGPGGKPQSTLQLESPGACGVKCTSPESTAIHSDVNHAKDCLDFDRRSPATVQHENQGSCSVELTAVKLGSCSVELTAVKSGSTHSEDNLSLDVKHEILVSSCECRDVEETEKWKVTPAETCEKDTCANTIEAQDSMGEEELLMVKTISDMSPVKEDISFVHETRLENQDVLLKSSIKEQDKQNAIDDRSCENHIIQGGILSVDSSTRKSDTSDAVSTGNEGDSIQHGETENVIQKDDKNVTPLEGNEFSEKQDSDSLKEFEETELLCLSDEESNTVVKNINKADFGQTTISGLGDRETILSHNVLRDRDEPKADESSIYSSLNDSDKLASGSKLQYSCKGQENIKQKTSKGEFCDMDQDCKSLKDSSPEIQDRIDSKTSNEEQYLREEDCTFSQEVDQLKIAKSEESEDGTVPPPTPSSMAIWQEEDEEEIEEEEGEVSGEETHKGQIKQMVSEFGDIVCRRLSLLLESQTMLSITDDDDIPFCENAFFASEMDENEREYNEDFTKQSKERKDEINSSLNAGKDNLVGLIVVDRGIDNSKQMNEEVIDLSEIYTKLDENITVDIKDVRVRHDKRLFLTEVPTCNNNLSRFESSSGRSEGDGNHDYVVSAEKARSVDDRDNCMLNEHIKQDFEVNEIDEDILESSDIHLTSFSEAENKHNYLLGNDEENVVEIMDVFDDVIAESYSQVFQTEKEESFLEAEMEISTSHVMDQLEDEHDIKSLKMNEIDPAQNESKEHHEGKPTETLNPAALMSSLVGSSKYQEECDNVDSIADDSRILYTERDNALSLNNGTHVDSITMQNDFRDVESSSADTSTTFIEQESIMSLKIHKMEEAYSRAQTMDELGDRTPTAESFPELTALTELASASVDNLVMYQHSGRLSVSRTESDLDISEQRDDLSTEGMYADDEDDETMEILFTRTYTEPKQGTEAFVSCTVVNSAFRQANRDNSFLKYAVPDTLDLLEGSIEVMPPSFIKAKKEMRDIQVHLQSLRKQMEHFHDDIDESSLPDYLTADPRSRRAITD